MDINHILERLENSPKDEITKTIDELATFYGVSRQSVWREANKGGFRIRSERSDKGQRSASIDILYRVASLVHTSRRLNGIQTYTVKQACKDLKKQGVEIPVGYQRICSLLRENSIDPESLATPDQHVKLISLHPNQVHQFDVSNCLQWYFEGGKLKERNTKMTLYKNKLIKTAKSIKEQLLRFVIVDHCSGAFFVWYYYATGELAEDGADFFYRAWADKRPLIEKTLGICDYKGAYQFKGVPKILVSDKGSILTNKIMKNLMQGLGVKLELHQAGNPRAKGMVEGLMRTINDTFESKLRLFTINDLESLNRFALDWCIEHNCFVKFRRDKIRANLWLKIRQDELRLCPPETMFKKLQHKSAETRKCNGNCEISYEGRVYICPDVNAAYKTVTVVINAYEYPAIDIHFNNQVYIVSPLQKDSYGRNISPNSVPYGEYRTHKRTNLQKAKNRLEEIAYEEYGITFNGKNDKRRAVPPATSVLPEVALKQDDKVIYLQKQGVEITTPDIHAPLTDENIKYISVYQDCERRETTFSRSKLITQEGGSGGKTGRFSSIAEGERSRTGERFPQRYVRLVPVIQMIRMYVDEIGKLTIEENKRLKAAFKEGVPADFTITDIDNFLHGEENTANKKFA